MFDLDCKKSYAYLELQRLAEECFRQLPDNLTEDDICAIISEGMVFILSEMRAKSKEIRDDLG